MKLKTHIFLVHKLRTEESAAQLTRGAHLMVNALMPLFCSTVVELYCFRLGSDITELCLQIQLIFCSFRWGSAVFLVRQGLKSRKILVNISAQKDAAPVVTIRTTSLKFNNSTF